METKTIELETKVEQLNQDLINKPQQINNTDNSQNIKINNYGSENYDHLTTSNVNHLMEAPYTAVEKIIRLLHYHPKHPENNNMKITNIKGPHIRVLYGDKWKYGDKKKVLDGLLDKALTILANYRDMSLHSDFKNGCYDDFTIKIDNDDTKLIGQMISDLELLILNNS